MSTSVKRSLKGCMIYLGVSIFLALFGAIYEHYSHEVYSYFMIYAFAVPLVMGALPWGMMALRGGRFPRLTADLWSAGVAALTVGSLFRGVLDIYGTTNRLIGVYPIAGSVLCGAGAISFLVSRHLHEASVVPEQGEVG